MQRFPGGVSCESTRRARDTILTRRRSATPPPPSTTPLPRRGLVKNQELSSGLSIVPNTLKSALGALWPSRVSWKGYIYVITTSGEISVWIFPEQFARSNSGRSAKLCALAIYLQRVLSVSLINNDRQKFREWSANSTLFPPDRRYRLIEFIN